MKEFLTYLGGFSEINTGSQDYGQGIVRVSSALKEKHADVFSGIKRGGLVHVKSDSGAAIVGVIRYFDNEKEMLCVEYDDRLALGVDKGKTAKLRVGKASYAAMGRFFWFHSNPIVSIEFRLAVVLVVASTSLGLIIGASLP